MNRQEKLDRIDRLYASSRDKYRPPGREIGPFIKAALKDVKCNHAVIGIALELWQQERIEVGLIKDITFSRRVLTVRAGNASAAYYLQQPLKRCLDKLRTLANTTIVRLIVIP
jgi:hypothetical protein